MRNESVSGFEYSPLEISMSPVGAERHGCGNKLRHCASATCALSILFGGAGSLRSWSFYKGNYITRNILRSDSGVYEIHVAAERDQTEHQLVVDGEYYSATRASRSPKKPVMPT